jgi:dolichyl-phosphate-mannose--protein O-mannosyl transferase
VGKSKASDYFTAGIILIVLAAVIWFLEYFVLDVTMDNVILFVIPSVFGLLSLAHFAVAPNKWYSSI